MSLTNFPNGVSSFGMPLIGLTTGNVYFVDSGSGTAANNTMGNQGKSTQRPFKTLQFAVDSCTASNGDIVFLMPGHAEAPVITIDLDKAGVTVIGLGVGRTRPVITAAHTIASDVVIAIGAANVLLKNIIIATGTNTGGNSVQVTVGADDFTMEDCLIEQGAKNLSAVTITSNFDRTIVRRCVFTGTAANPDIAIDIGVGSGDCAEWIVEDCLFNYTRSAGLDLGAVYCRKICLGILVKDCTMIGMDATAINLLSSATGLAQNIAVLSNNATVNEMITGAALALVDTRVTYKGASAAVVTTIPATTATP